MAIRTYGLSGSGMDVDQMVKDMMKAQRTRYESLVQKKTQAEWKKADFNTIYTNVSDFRNTVFNYKLTSTTLPKAATSSDEKVVKATANPEAANISHSIKVTQLAEGAKLTSSASVTLEGNKGKDTLANQFYEGTAPSPATFNITISDGTTTKAVEVDTSKSIYEFVSSINNAGINVKASYDTNLDRFFIYSTQPGKKATIDFSQTTTDGKTTDTAGIDFLKDKLNLEFDTETPLAAKGKNAEFILDGQALTQSSNSFTITGVTYNLQAVDLANTVTVTVNADNDKTIANVKAFVEAYNSVLSKINGELSETKYKDFLPLTTDQRAEMSESEIKAWEEKAKSGSLRRNSTLQTTINTMRNNIASPISGMSGIYNSLSSIGITTGTYTENGKLYLDETKLKTALEADPDIVNKLFTANGDSTSSQGIATRLYDTLKTTMDNIDTTAGRSAGISDDTESTLAKQIASYNKQMMLLNDKLADMEERYYNQFNAMETALNRLNQQSSWLSQQLGTNS